MSQQVFCLSSVFVIVGGILFVNGVVSFSPELTFLGILSLMMGSYMTIQVIQNVQD